MGIELSARTRFSMPAWRDMNAANDADATSLKIFRYPGIRSDSDIFTLSFPWEPWTGEENVADGPDIRDYLTATASKHGIDGHIRFNTRVLSADWDSATDTWTVQTEDDGVAKAYRGRFLFFGTGYYNYDEPYTPDFPGIETSPATWCIRSTGRSPWTIRASAWW